MVNSFFFFFCVWEVSLRKNIYYRIIIFFKYGNKFWVLHNKLYYTRVQYIMLYIYIYSFYFFSFIYVGMSIKNEEQAYIYQVDGVGGRYVGA